MAPTTSPMAPAKSAIASSMTLRRAAAARSANSRCSAIALVTSSAMSCETTMARSMSLPEENQCLRASARIAARST